MNACLRASTSRAEQQSELQGGTNELMAFCLAFNILGVSVPAPRPDRVTGCLSTCLTGCLGTCVRERAVKSNKGYRQWVGGCVDGIALVLKTRVPRLLHPSLPTPLSARAPPQPPARAPESLSTTVSASALGSALAPPLPALLAPLPLAGDTSTEVDAPPVLRSWGASSVVSVVSALFVLASNSSSSSSSSVPSSRHTSCLALSSRDS